MYWQSDYRASKCSNLRIDTACCLNSLKAWRVDKYAPTNVIIEDQYPSEKCGTGTFFIYANPNGTVSITE